VIHSRSSELTLSLNGQLLTLILTRYRTGGGETICHPADAVRRGWGRRQVRSPHISGGRRYIAKLQAASVPIAYAAAPWDIQTDGSRYSRMPP